MSLNTYSPGFKSPFLNSSNGQSTSAKRSASRRKHRKGQSLQLLGHPRTWLRTNWMDDKMFCWVLCSRNGDRRIIFKQRNVVIVNRIAARTYLPKWLSQDVVFPSPLHSAPHKNISFDRTWLDLAWQLETRGRRARLRTSLTTDRRRNTSIRSQSTGFRYNYLFIAALSVTLLSSICLGHAPPSMWLLWQTNEILIGWTEIRYMFV